MTTTSKGTAMSTKRPTPQDRFADWVLDRDGDLYGDERERVRWYEGTAVASSIQTFVVPWTLAVAVWSHSEKGTAGALLAVAVLFYLPLIWTAVYAQTKGVRVYDKKWTSKRLLLTLAFVVPYALFFLGVLNAFAGLGSETALGSWVGAALGLGGGLIGVWVAKRREQRREHDLEDVE